VAPAALARIGEIVRAVCAIPDLGAVRAAEILSARLGVIVTADGVAELSRRGPLPVADYFKDRPLFDGRAIEAFADPEAAEEASRAGNLRIAEDAARYLRIRRSDLAHLTRCGLLQPADCGHGPWDRRDRYSVPLYHTGDLDDLAADRGIDWEAVRATAKGHRSLLARLPSAQPGAGTGSPAAVSAAADEEAGR